MRILHTSDWHIGRRFHGHDLLADQEAVLGSVAEIAADERVDVVLVSGDLYDRAVPGAEAVEVATAALAKIRATGAALVVTPGNHDSAARLGAFAEFAAAGGLHLRTSTARLAEPVLLPDAHGQVAFYGLPYLDPAVAAGSLGVPERGHAGVLGEAMNRVRADLARRDARSVVLAPAFVAGAAASGSERAIAVGGVEQVPAPVFAGVDYVALGHLHGAQRLTEPLRYSGSPLAYSFAEAAHRKSVWLVELDAAGLAEVRRVCLPVPRPLATLRGRIADLLTAPEYERVAEHYLSVSLTDPVRPLEAMRRLRDRFPYAVALQWEPDGGTGERTMRYAQAVRGRSDGELAASFVADCRASAPSTSEQGLLDEAFQALRVGEAG
jgi:exonuclease SbcD